ncbi:MAG: DUF1631 family protein [Gammaproteobacteria bacterium]|nr:DUF1631 family protein [Gammaproteobacteria bacterium]
MTNPAERRRYERFEIKLPATIAAGDARPVQCLVRDYCSGGMLLSLKAGEVAEDLFEVGQPARLQTHLLTHAGRRPITIKSSIAWLHGNYLGIEFAKPSNLIVEVLARHDRYARQQNEPAGRNAKIAKGDCVVKIAEAAQGLLPGMLREVVNQTLDVLVETVDRVSSDTERQQVYGDMNALERLRGQDSLVRAVTANAVTPTAGDESNVVPGELKLIDTVEFERWLEASRTATLLERKFRPRLATIGARIARVARGQFPGIAGCAVRTEELYRCAGRCCARNRTGRVHPRHTFRDLCRPAQRIAGGSIRRDRCDPRWPRRAGARCGQRDACGQGDWQQDQRR